MRTPPTSRRTPSSEPKGSRRMSVLSSWRLPAFWLIIDENELPEMSFEPFGPVSRTLARLMRPETPKLPDICTDVTGPRSTAYREATQLCSSLPEYVRVQRKFGLADTPSSGSSTPRRYGTVAENTYSLFSVCP